MKLHKEITNVELAELLRDVAAAYELKNPAENKFRIIAYERAADAIDHLSVELKDLWNDGKLKDIPGIGESIGKHLDELFRTGRSSHFDLLLKSLPRSMFELMKLKGVGPKTAYRLVKDLKISDKDPFGDLKNKIQKNMVSKLEGFGAQSQEDILKSLNEYKIAKPTRLLFPYAESIANEVCQWMREENSVLEIECLGSLRRKAATIGDIDLAVASSKPKEVIERFISYPKKSRIIKKGNHTASILLPGNIEVDIMVQPKSNFGSLLQHFTGSKSHNIALREYAIKKNLSVSDYGITKNKRLIKFDNEEKFYKYLGLDWIPPEIREDQGEIQRALDHSLPNLIELKEVKGDFHIHSNFDIETSHDLGESSMQEIIETASNLGYEYIAFTEHNPSKSKHNEDKIIDLIKRKKDKIDEINYSLSKSVKTRVKKVFNSLEIDILPDGRLPVPEKGLELLDFALVSIHSSFDLDREKMTKRVLNAFNYPKVKILAHPTARLLNRREGIELDWQKLFDACLSKKIFLEINANPSRLDLPDALVFDAIKNGVKLALGTDSHHKNSLLDMRFGVNVARRGWAASKDIINTLSLPAIQKLFT
jgi:DNA polymerase (family 10)